MIDDLQDSHSDCPEEMVSTSLPELSRVEISRFLDLLLAPATSQNARPPYVILIARRSELSWWQDRFSHTIARADDVYVMNGLRQTDALSLAGQCMNGSAIQATTKHKAEFDRLDTILRICEFNPFAIQIALNDREVISEQFLQALVAGMNEDPLFSNQASKDRLASPALQKFQPVAIKHLLHLYHYWTDGPYVEVLREACRPLEVLEIKADYEKAGEQCHKDCEGDGKRPEVEVRIENGEGARSEKGETPTLDFILAYLQDRGYLRSDGNLIGWISPLLTLYLRTHQSELLRLSRCNSNKTGQIARAYQYQRAFIEAINVHELIWRLVSEVHGRDFATEGQHFRKSAGNVLSSLMLCSSDAHDHLPLDDWPWLTWRFFAPISRQILVSTELHIFSIYYEAILKACFSRWSNASAPPAYQMFIFSILNHLFATTWSEIRDQTRSKKMIGRAIMVIKASELKYGRIQDFETLYQKSLAYKYHAVTLLQEGKDEEADDAWQTMLETDELVYSTNLEEQHDTSDETLSGLSERAIRLLGKDEIQREEMRERIKPKKPHEDPVSIGWRSLKLTMWPQLKKCLASVRNNKDSSTDLREMMEPLFHTSPQLRNLRDAYE